MPDVQPFSLFMAAQRQPGSAPSPGSVPAPAPHATPVPTPRTATAAPSRSAAPRSAQAASGQAGRHFVDFRPDDTKVVQVRVAEVWLYGVLEGFGPGAGNTWRGLVSWVESPGGRQARQWFDEKDIRPLQV